MSTKTRATKPQPKPLDPLEKMVQAQIDIEDEAAAMALADECNATRDQRIAVRLARVQAAISGESVGASPDPLAGVPEADSGDALVERWCVAWDKGWAYGHVVKIKQRTYLRYRSHQGAVYEHASPIERGVPEAIRKAVEG